MPVAFISLWRVSESLHNDLLTSLDALVGSLPLFHCFLTFCGAMWPYVVPPVFVMLLESPLSLRAWIAVQKTPYLKRMIDSPPRSSLSSRLHNLRKHGVAHIAPVYLLFVSLLTSYLQCVVNVPGNKLRILESVLLGPLFCFATFRLFGLLFRMYRLSIRRDADGDPRLIRTIRPSVPRVPLIVPMSFSVLTTYHAVYLDSNICKAVVHAALIHIFVSLNARSKESIRAAGVYALTNIATLLALTIFLALHAKRVGMLVSNSPSSSPNSNGTRVEDSSNHGGNYTSMKYVVPSGIEEPPNGYRWPLFALAVLWNIFPVELVALCYRFDYMRFIRLQGVVSSIVGALGASSPLPMSEPKDEAYAYLGTPTSLTHDLLLDGATGKEGQDVVRRGEQRVQDGVERVGPIYLPPEIPDSFYTRLPAPPSCSRILPALPRTSCTLDCNSNTSGERAESQIRITEDTHSDSDSDSNNIKGTPLPRSLSLFSPHLTPQLHSGIPIPIPIPTPFHSHLRLRLRHRHHLHIQIPFPAFLTTLTAYLISTLLLSLHIYLAFPSLALRFRLGSASGSGSPVPVPVPVPPAPPAQEKDALNALSSLVPLLPLVTFPLMTFSLPLGLAFLMRHVDGGESAMKDLWKYEEDWRSAPVPVSVCVSDHEERGAAEDN